MEDLDRDLVVEDGQQAWGGRRSVAAEEGRVRVERMAPRPAMQPVPRPVPGAPGLVEVDTTWGTIQPMELAEGIRAVGEMEVIEHLSQGLPVVDSRDRDSFANATIPGASNLPFTEAAARVDELDRGQPTVFFCNGPQCGQSPTAIRGLLEAGYPPEAMRYYRGGQHDWITLGLPVMPGSHQR